MYICVHLYVYVCTYKYIYIYWSVCGWMGQCQYYKMSISHHCLP